MEVSMITPGSSLNNQDFLRVVISVEHILDDPQC